MITTNDFYSNVTVDCIKPKRSKKKIGKLASNCLEGKFLFNYAGSVVRGMPADIIRLLSQSASFLDDDLTRSTLISTVLSCERRCSGSGIIFLLLASGLAQIGSEQKRRVSAEDLHEVIRFYTGNGSISKIIEKIVHENGFQYEIDFIESHVDNLCMHSDNLLQVKGHIDPIFSKKNLAGQYFVFQTTGKIETIGEIDPLLQWAQQGNKKVVLVAQQFSPDIAMTLEKNYDKKLHVIPFVASENDLNLDQVCAEVVRPENGVRFSNLDFDAFNSFYTTIKNDTVSIESASGAARKVKIFIPKNHLVVKNVIIERLQAGVSITKNALLHGVEHIKVKDSKITVPSYCVDYALKAIEAFENVLKTSCIITLEQKNVYQNKQHA